MRRCLICSCSVELRTYIHTYIFYLESSLLTVQAWGSERLSIIVLLQDRFWLLVSNWKNDWATTWAKRFGMKAWAIKLEVRQFWASNGRAFPSCWSRVTKTRGYSCALVLFCGSMLQDSTADRFYQPFSWTLPWSPTGLPLGEKVS